MNRRLAFDTETCLIRPGVTAPEIACLTWQEPKCAPQIVHHTKAEPIIRSWLEDDELTLIGANTAFDTCVVMANYPDLVDLMFRAYRLGRIACVQYRDRLLDIAAGRFQGYHTKTGGWIKPTYNLDALARRYLGMQLDKPLKVKCPITGKSIDDPEHVRLRFGELRDLPIEVWDEVARERGFHGPPPTQYAMEDAVAALGVFDEQEPHADEFLGEQKNTERKALALQLMSVWGFRTSAEGVVELARKANAERDKIQELLVEEGLIRPDGTRNVKAARKHMVDVCHELKMPVQLTDTGLDKNKTRGMTEEEIELEYASLGEDACIETGDELLKDYAAFGRWGSTLSKDVTALAKGTVYPIHTRPGMAATTRTTTSNPNVQNWGTGWGPRECIVPRKGRVFIQADYPQLELKTLAQTCIDLFGWSKLAETLNAGKDPHTQVAAVIMGVTYEEAKKRKNEPAFKLARQSGKIANFGFPGGMGAKSLVKNAKKVYGVLITIEQAMLLKAQWFAAFPEMELYFEYMSALCDNPSKTGEIQIPRSKQIRGGAMYCALCNTPFQGLGAVCSGRALWLLAEACYVERGSVLFGSRNVCHIHDENILECADDDLVHERAWELARLMDAGANEYLVDVPMKTDPQAMRFWSKAAFTLLDGRGRIQPWNGEWQCEECNKVFASPFRKDVKKCAQHEGSILYAA